jgi:hypothetical protein
MNEARKAQEIKLDKKKAKWTYLTASPLLRDEISFPNPDMRIENNLNFTFSVSEINVIYEGVSKIFRTGAAIYTAVVLARSTGRL